MNIKIMSAWQNSKMTISLRKFTMICNKLPNMKPIEIADFIDGGEEGWQDYTFEEHQKWLQKSNTNIIADWVWAGR